MTILHFEESISIVLSALEWTNSFTRNIIADTGTFGRELPLLQSWKDRRFVVLIHYML